MSAFTPNPGQLRAQEVLTSGATHIGLEGGSRSGKTFWFLRAIAHRANAAPGSRHAAMRFRFAHIKQSIIRDTWPKMLEMCVPDAGGEMNRQDWFYAFPNGSEVWFGGLDDKERVEKVLGNEYVTLFLNEVSQIAWDARNKAMTRLAQKVQRARGEGELPLRAYYDLNPTDTFHWAYKLFHEKRDPVSNKPLPRPEDYAHCQLNPADNAENLPRGYIEQLEALPAHDRLRFLEGVYADGNPNALFSDVDIEKWRHDRGELPPLVRVVVGVDPSGSGDKDNAENDEIGIAVGALGADGNAYLLEDLSLKSGPGTWGQAVASAYERHEADLVVGEGNFGGDMVRHVVHTVNNRVPYKMVTASRGKVQRAQPFSALYSQGRVRHVGRFDKLERELRGFSTHGYLADGSPNRADAWVWVLAELFPGVVSSRKKPEKKPEGRRPPPGGWMAA